ncbi:ATP-dependent Clp protease ATP-binding subunit [Candidatus Dojkabacteria bacterium]|nr:ATP-dependent Clp protease ATP-binding subunit [Candidatus Dojkabacteria bacterium]
MSDIQSLDQTKALDKMTDYAKKAIINAFEIARGEKSREVYVKHMFMGLISNKSNIASRLLSKLGVDLAATIESLRNKEIDQLDNVLSISDNILSEEVKQVLVDAYVLATEFDHVYVGTEHILLSILKMDAIDFVNDLKKVGLSYENVEKALQNFATYNNNIINREGPEGYLDDTSRKNRKSGEEESAIDMYSINFNELAKKKKFMPIYGRDDEIERMIHILARKTKSNPILVGEAGVGKTAVIEGLAQRIIEKRVPRSFYNKEIVSIDLAGILAGSKIRGDVEERLLAIIDEAIEDPDVILFIDEIHMIIGAGSAGQGSMDVANILKPHLTNGEISVIGATTLNEYQKYFESDAAITRRFQPVIIDEISSDEAVQALRFIKKRLEDFHKVVIEDEAIVDAVKLSARYINDRYLPDKAIDVLDEAAAGKKISNEDDKTKYTKLKERAEEFVKDKNKALDENKIKEAADFRKKEVEALEKLKELENEENKKGSRFFVTSEDIRKVVSSLTKIPTQKIDTDTLKILSSLEKKINKKVVGQPDAVRKVSAALRRSRVGISDEARPLASFLFLGPTGIGKTELAKVIASELFGSENSLIQVDMSEFMEQHSVSKLIGSPPGYIGFQEGGQLTEKIRHNPYCVLLLDEIEKAHPDLLNIFLQVLEEGELKDSKGRKISFKNTVIVMTSNIGANEISNDRVLGFSVDNNTTNDPSKIKVDQAFEQMKEKLFDKLKIEIRPELLNRIDEIIVFRGLDDKDIVEITRLEIDKLNKRLLNINLSVAVSEGAVKYIAKEGFSKEYGARNIRRKIQELLENPIAEMLVTSGITLSKEIEVLKVGKIKTGLKISKT